IPFTDLPPRTGANWETIFDYALDPDIIATLEVPTGVLPRDWLTYVGQRALLFGGNPGFVYNTTTRRLGFTGDMATKLSTKQFAALTSAEGLLVLQYDAFGFPATYTASDGKRYFQTDRVSWADVSAVSTLYTASEGAPAANDSTQFG